MHVHFKGSLETHTPEARAAVEVALPADWRPAQGLALSIFTPSMRIASQDLKLDHLWVVHAGRDEFPLHEQTTAISLDKLVARKRLG